jgi:hypothetical protein
MAMSNLLLLAGGKGIWGLTWVVLFGAQHEITNSIHPRIPVFVTTDE